MLDNELDIVSRDTLNLINIHRLYTAASEDTNVGRMCLSESPGILRKIPACRENGFELNWLTDPRYNDARACPTSFSYARSFDSPPSPWTTESPRCRCGQNRRALVYDRYTRRL